MASFSGDVRMTCVECRKCFYKPYVFVKENPELACPHCGKHQRIDLSDLHDRDASRWIRDFHNGTRTKPIIGPCMVEGVITRKRPR
jgi:hypothetical protein